MVKDICRVQLDLVGEQKYTHSLHPMDILFRGEFDVIDYELVDQIYIAVLFPGQVYIFD